MKTHRKQLALWVAVGILVVAGVGVYAWRHQSGWPVQAQQPKAKVLVGSIDKVSADTSKLCSPYANVCFTYPANWTAKKTTDGIADLLYRYNVASGVELNGPTTSTGVVFTKAGANTDTICSQASVCSLHISTLSHLDNGLYVLAASVESVEPTAGADIYTPFVAVASASSLKAAGVTLDGSENGKTVTITSFNPDFRVKNGGLVKLLAVPGTSWGPTPTAAWLSGTEAQSMMVALSSVAPQMQH